MGGRACVSLNDIIIITITYYCNRTAAINPETTSHYNICAHATTYRNHKNARSPPRRRTSLSPDAEVDLTVEAVGAKHKIMCALAVRVGIITTTTAAYDLDLRRYDILIIMHRAAADGVYTIQYYYTIPGYNINTLIIITV